MLSESRKIAYTAMLAGASFRLAAELFQFERLFQLSFSALTGFGFMHLLNQEFHLEKSPKFSLFLGFSLITSALLHHHLYPMYSDISAGLIGAGCHAIALSFLGSHPEPRR